MADDVLSWLDDHVYVPLIVGLVILAIIMGVIYFKCCRTRFAGSKYVYKRLEHEAEIAQQIDKERKVQQNTIRDNAYLNCQFYLRSHPNYTGMEQLKDLGSRIDKYWFLVSDARTNEENILSCMQFNTKMSVPFTKATSKTMKDIFSLLKHPYIFPIMDFDFSVEQNLIFVFHPVSPKGSLKDLIYQSRYTESWYSKYSQRHKGLPVEVIRKYGMQVLTGMLYLEAKGFPTHGNIQSGNIMLVEDTCKIAGYENCFLANTSRVFGLVRKKLKDNKNVLDTLCFGHLIYEMAFGFELASAQPEPQHLIGHQSPDIVEILNFIFGNETGVYPSIQMIADHSFFRNVVLIEMNRYNPAKIHLSEPMKVMLKALRKGKPLKAAKPTSAKKKRITSQSSEQSTPTTPVTPTTPSTPRTPSTPKTPSTPASLSKAPSFSSSKSSSTLQFPPPPPPPPMSPSTSDNTDSAPPEIQALLGEIRKGMKLKKAKTNDRSAPKV